MKKSIFYLLCILALTAFSTNKFTDTAKPVKAATVLCSYALHREVDGKGRPASTITTDANGKFVLKVKEGGQFKVSVSFVEILKKIGAAETIENPQGSNFVISLELDPGTASNITINGVSKSTNITVGANNETCMLQFPAAGGTVNGKLTYTKTR